MADTPVTPPERPILRPDVLLVPPAAVPAPTWRAKYGPMIVWALTIALSSLLSAVATYFGIPTPPPLVVTNTVERVVEKSIAAEGYAPTFGWQPPDAETVAANLDPKMTMQFAQTPAGRAVLGDADVYLWQAVRKVNNRGPPWYPNVDQQNVGCCVGCGWKHCSDVCQATQILAGKRATWLPTSVEVIYGESRVDIGGGRISGDGSVGAWARQAAATFGVAAMQKYGSVDLSTFSPARARDYGRHGVPADVKAAAHDHLIKGTALVRTWADVKKAIGQGYPVAVCSDQGFTMERDANGFARAQGTWGHCMSIIGVRTLPREGGFILNSWGDNAHTGPVFPSDMPVAGFWADAKTIERMVSQNDSFALADIAGFPARRPDWFILNTPRQFDGRMQLVRSACDVRDFAEYALAP